MSKISFFHSLGCPLMLGPSRKSFIGKIMGSKDTISRIRWDDIIGNNWCEPRRSIF